MQRTNPSDILHLADYEYHPRRASLQAAHKYPTGSKEEIAAFEKLQKHLPDQYEKIFSDPMRSRTVVIVPSLSMHSDELDKISGVHHYEERMLCMLMLLRLPRTRLIFITSQPIAPSIIDYYLHLLPGIPATHARKRLTLLSCYDGRSIPLTQKILERPRLIKRIRDAIPGPSAGHMTCFNATVLERALAVRLGVPLYANNPSLEYLGSKSGCREIFKQAGVPLADGFEHLNNKDAIVNALVVLKKRYPSLRRAVIKLNEGFSGEGNALFYYDGAPADDTLTDWVTKELPVRIAFEAKHESWDRYLEKYEEMGGIVEIFIEGKNKRSPSVQCRVNPLGEANVISTHDQVLGGPSGQIFLGCTFPADKAYRIALQKAAQKVADVMRDKGVLGRFAIDFISVKDGDHWKHYAIEVNLRKGGTTHPYLMLQFLTDGTFDLETGDYYIPTGQRRYYYASDNLTSDLYKGLSPDDLVDIAVANQLHFHGTTQEGVVFHLIGALSEYGKLGVLCVGATRERARALYEKTVDVLNAEGQPH